MQGLTVYRPVFYSKSAFTRKFHAFNFVSTYSHGNLPHNYVCFSDIEYLYIFAQFQENLRQIFFVFTQFSISSTFLV